MSFVLLGILNSQASGVAQAYFLNVLGDSDANRGRATVTDPDGNAYMVADSNLNFLLAKFDPTGIAQWKRFLGSGNQELPRDIAIDSQNNVYAVGYSNNLAGSYYDIYIAKYSQDGVIQWQKALTRGASTLAYGIDIDTSDNIYTVGQPQSPNLTSIVKLNTAGVIQWQRILGTVDKLGRDVDVAPNGDVYVTSEFYNETFDIRFYVVKYNSSGVIQWQRTLDGGSNDQSEVVATDSSGNVYLAGQTSSAGAGGTDALLAKWDSSGNFQWQRVLGGTAQERIYSVETDSSDNVYIFGWTQSNASSIRNYLLAKYDFAGNLAWQRTLGTSGSELTEAKLSIDSFDNLFLTGETNSMGAGSQDVFTAKLPNDGSLVGTYVLDGVNVNYEIGSLTAATSFLTPATASESDVAGSFSVASGTGTDSAASVTSITTDITP